jgi:hypothetical protein
VSLPVGPAFGSRFRLCGRDQGPTDRCRGLCDEATTHQLGKEAATGCGNLAEGSKIHGAGDALDVDRRRFWGSMLSPNTGDRFDGD